MADKNEDLAPRIAALENRVTTIETLLNQRIPGFEAVGVRVTELSAAFQNANARLTAVAATVEALSSSAPAPSEARITALETGLAELTAQVQALAATRGRTGLSGRLLSIEEKLDLLLPPDPPEEPSDPE